MQATRLREAARRMRNRLWSGAVILIYHHLSERETDPFNLTVTAQHFAEHLEALRKVAHPLSLAQLTQALRTGRVPRRAVVITFDDGYANNLALAKPLLERYDVPATVFVTTGMVGQQQELWQGQLEQMLLCPATLPETLALCIGGQVYQWKPDAATEGLEDDFERRKRLYQTVHNQLRALPEALRLSALEQLQECTGVTPICRPTHRIMTQEEVVRLAEGGRIEVGAHTMTHPVLSSLPPSEQYREIVQSKNGLEAILERPVQSFAYPYGTRAEYNRETVALAREAGFACACANFGRLARRGTDLYQLPRFWGWDRDGEQFTCLIDHWFGG